MRIYSEVEKLFSTLWLSSGCEVAKKPWWLKEMASLLTKWETDYVSMFNSITGQFFFFHRLLTLHLHTLYDSFQALGDAFLDNWRYTHTKISQLHIKRLIRLPIYPLIYMFTCFLFCLFLDFSPVLALQFQYGFFHSSHVLLTLSLLCIKRPVIRHKVQFLLHISVQAARLPAAQSWNQSPNPETLKPSGRVRQRRKRHTSTWRGRQKECRWTCRQKSLVWIK